jgi:hypothetical protein
VPTVQEEIRKGGRTGVATPKLENRNAFGMTAQSIAIDSGVIMV